MQERARAAYPIWKVIGASAAGTMIEWYDFYIFGSLATIVSGLFFPTESFTLRPATSYQLPATGLTTTSTPPRALS